MFLGDRRPRGGAPPPWGGATTDCACAAREGTGRDGRGLNDRRGPPWAFRPEQEQPCRPWQRECRPEWAYLRDYRPCPKDCRPCRREREQPCRLWLRGYRPAWACPRDYHPCPKERHPCRSYLREREQQCHPWQRECRPAWAYPRGYHPCPKECRPYLRGSCREAWCRVGSYRHLSSFCRAGRSSPRGL